MRRCPAQKLVMVGDRYLTDVVYGNRHGMLTIRCTPLTLAGETLAVRMVRSPVLPLVSKTCCSLA
jgi:phosphatidylglycerophosphatase GEP4